MIESPLIQRIVDESKREERVQAAVGALEERFSVVPPSITAGLEQVKNLDRLAWLARKATVCAGLQAFEDILREELPKPRPASTRGKRRPKKSEE